MKLLIVLGVLVSGYTYILMYTADIVLDQTSQLSAIYQNADEIVATQVEQ